MGIVRILYGSQLLLTLESKKASYHPCFEARFSDGVDVGWKTRGVVTCHHAIQKIAVCLYSVAVVIYAPAAGNTHTALQPTLVRLVPPIGQARQNRGPTNKRSQPARLDRRCR